MAHGNTVIRLYGYTECMIYKFTNQSAISTKNELKILDMYQEGNKLMQSLTFYFHSSILCVLPSIVKSFYVKSAIIPASHEVMLVMLI